MKPRLYIDQKISPFANIYKVYDSDEAGEKGGLVAMAQQKRLAFKEKVSFYTDEQKTELAYTFRAEKVLDVHGRYLVEDKNGELIGMFKKDFKKSLLNSNWVVMDKDGTELFGVRESNMSLAVFRRVVGFLPIIGDLFDLMLQVLRYHFVFFDIKSGEDIGKYKKITRFRDQYTLYMTDEKYVECDWRVLAAMGVGLDALQSR